MPFVMGFLMGVNICPPFLLSLSLCCFAQRYPQKRALLCDLLFRQFDLLSAHDLRRNAGKDKRTQENRPGIRYNGRVCFHDLRGLFDHEKFYY